MDFDEISTSYKIKSYRVKAGYKTQKDVAKVLSISVPTYVRFETQPFSIPLKQLFKLANLFGCEVRDFFKS